jgi:hypothetical protein
MAKPTREEILAELSKREGIQSELASREVPQEMAQPEAQGYLQRLMQMPGGQALSRAGQAISGLGDIGFVKGFGYAYPREIQERFGGIQQLFGGQPRELPQETPTTSFGETVGRGLGSLAGNITAAAPIVAGSVAALPEMAIAAPLLGAGLAGGLETKGGYPERILGALKGAGEVGAGLAVKPGIRAIKAIGKTPTNEMVGEILQKNFNKSYQEAAGLLNQAGTEAKKIGIDVLKTGRGTPLNKSFWGELSHNMDTAKSTKDLIKQAKTGNFDALRKLQSDMGKRSNWLKSKDTSADYDMGKNLGELRDSLNDYIENHFEKSGYENISNMIKEGMNKYRQVMQTYKDPLIAKAIGPEEEISEGLLKRTMKTSKTMKQLRKANPELAPLHQIIKDKQALQKLGITGGGGLPSFAALKYLFGSNKQPQNEFEQ